jgi:UPF0716 protein FxsA
MFLRLLLLMTVVPALELFLLIKIGETIGAMETVLIILFTGTVGAALAKREGLGVLQKLQQDAQEGIPPATRLVEGLLVLIGGVLLITPGVLTDISGFLLIIPVSRRLIAAQVKDQVAARVKVMPGVGFGAPGYGPGMGQSTVDPSGQRRGPKREDSSEEPHPGFQHPVL